MDNETLVRHLTAAAVADVPNSVGYYLNVSEGALTEKVFAGTEWTLPARIANVRADAPAAYLVGLTKRVVFTIDANNTLQNYIYNEDEDSWETGPLGAANIQAHPKSKIAATFDQGAPHVFYQAPAGDIEQTSSEDGQKWDVLGELCHDAKPVPGTVLSSITMSADLLYIFYESTDKSVHYLAKDNAAGLWKDNKMKSAELEENVQRLLGAGPGEKGEFGVYYQETSGKLFNVDSEGKKTELGHIDEAGKFTEKTSAECYYPCGGCCPQQPVIIIINNYYYGGGGGGYPRCCY